jgi:hypothetical protein
MNSANGDRPEVKLARSRVKLSSASVPLLRPASWACLTCSTRFSVLSENRWGLTVAGSSVRYRRRVRAFDRFELRSAFIGRDARFLYVHQAMFRGGEALSSALFRGAVTGPGGIVPTDEVAAALGVPGHVAALPDWAAAWSAAEAERPWPPEL